MHKIWQKHMKNQHTFCIFAYYFLSLQKKNNANTKSCYSLLEKVMSNESRVTRAIRHQTNS